MLRSLLCILPRRAAIQSAGFRFASTIAGSHQKSTKGTSVASFDKSDVDAQTLQHPYWNSDDDFFLPYSESDEGFGLLNESGMPSEIANVPEADRAALKHEWAKP